MSHGCHAAGCLRNVPPKMFACRSHWYALPQELQDAIWREYVEGQEVRKDPTASYMAVQQCAVSYLARADGYTTAAGEAGVAAVEYETIARSQGKDPLKGLPRSWEGLS